MSKSDDFQGSPASIFWFAFSAFLVSMAIAHGAAIFLQHTAPVEDVFYYRVVFTIHACILLLTPALCFHIFSRSDGRNTYWRAFWTVAYLALLVHLYWAGFDVCEKNFSGIWNGTAHGSLPECRVEHPKPDTFLALWWGFDVILAWLVRDNIKWVQVQRGAVH